MKNKLTKIYNIFKQIENMNGSVGWDQIDVFYYFYEEHKNFIFDISSFEHIIKVSRSVY